MKKIFTILSLVLMASSAFAQSIDFAERANAILYNASSANAKAYDNADFKAGTLRCYISDKAKTFYLLKMAGFPSSDVEVYPDRGWSLRYFYDTDQHYTGLQATRTNNDNYIGFPNLAVGDVVKVISSADPSLYSTGTTSNGIGVSADKEFSYRFNDEDKNVNAREYTYTVATAGQLVLHFAQNDMIYSIEVEEISSSTEKVNVNFFTQAESKITPRGSSKDLTNDGGGDDFLAGENINGTNFYTINPKGTNTSGFVSAPVQLWPNKNFTITYAYTEATELLRIGLRPTRTAETKNKIGLKSLAVGDVVTIICDAAPTVSGSDLGTSASATDYKITFHYGSKDFTKAVTIYSYTITTAGDMAWEFVKDNMIYSVQVTNGTTQPKEVASTYPVTISNSWASFCAPEDVALPSGVYAYVGNVVSDEAEGDDVLTINKVESNKIPANEGVLLYSDVDGDYELTSTTGAPVIEHNIFVGTVARTANPNASTTYSLYDNAGTIEFWNYTGNYIPANKAYLVYGGGSAGAPAKKLRVQVAPKMPTAIDEVQTNKAQSTKRFENGQLVIIRDGVKYNVQGQIVK